LLDNSIDALLTFDKNLQHQQNFSRYTVTVFVLTAKINQHVEVSKLTPKIKAFLNRGQLPLDLQLYRLNNQSYSLFKLKTTQSYFQ
jgi:hypothetical protein